MLLVAIVGALALYAVISNALGSPLANWQQVARGRGYRYRRSGYPGCVLCAGKSPKAPGDDEQKPRQG